MPNQYLSTRQVADITSLSKPTIWRLRQSGNFPSPVKLTKQRIAFRAADIEQWLADREAGKPLAA